MNQELIDEYIQWSKDTFGNEDWQRTLAKLQNEELNELSEAIIFSSRGRQDIANELADCFLLLFKVAHLNGFNVEDIESAMASKLIELHNRKYEPNGKRIK
jgi:NTP pyrophosphatase (non-canonical NTP hydrolase)